MNEAEILKRDLEALRESINLDWADLASFPLTVEEVAGIREHIRLCNEDLKDLLERRERLRGKRSD